jgi:hypothetical protein
MVNEMCTAIGNGAFPPAARTAGIMSAGGSLQLQRTNNNAVLGQITLAQLQAFGDFPVEAGRRPQTYKTIKDDLNWRAIYNYALRPVTYIDKGGNALQQMALTTTCRACGYYFLTNW